MDNISLSSMPMRAVAHAPPKIKIPKKIWRGLYLSRCCWLAHGNANMNNPINHCRRRQKNKNCTKMYFYRVSSNRATRYCFAVVYSPTRISEVSYAHVQVRLNFFRPLPGRRSIIIIIITWLCAPPPQKKQIKLCLRPWPLNIHAPDSAKSIIVTL